MPKPTCVGLGLEGRLHLSLSYHTGPIYLATSNMSHNISTMSQRLNHFKLISSHCLKATGIKRLVQSPGFKPKEHLWGGGTGDLQAIICSNCMTLSRYWTKSLRKLPTQPSVSSVVLDEVAGECVLPDFYLTASYCHQVLSCPYYHTSYTFKYKPGQYTLN